MSNNKKTHKRKKMRKWVKVLLAILGSLLGIAIILSIPIFAKIAKLKKDATSMVWSTTDSIFRESKTTLIYDTNGNEIATMQNGKMLYYLDYSEIPDTIANAFVVMEDRKFFEHSGIDYMAIGRAVIANYTSKSIAQGASTITQQLARNIYLTQDVTWERKIEEMFIARELEKRYTKNQILEYYLNNIYFANGYYGVEAAAKGYFNRSVKELSLSELAFLAAIPNNPSRYDPIEHYDNTMSRRNLILGQMLQEKMISSSQYYDAIEKVVEITQPEKSINNYVETYVRHSATESLMEAGGFTFVYDFDSEASYNSYMDRYYDVYSQCQEKLFSGGYSIYTSIDMDAQQKLQQSIDENLADFTALSDEGIYKMQGAATCIDNVTGNVVAIVGGRSQELKGYTLNRAYQSFRQPGSSIKPLSVYTPYLMLGNTPDTKVVDEPIKDGPANADETYAGEITLRQAVSWSKNTVAWKIYSGLTPQVGLSFLYKMQFKKVYVDKDKAAGALGGFTYGVTTEEMAGAYSTINNDGVYRTTTCIKRIINASGATVIDMTYRGVNVYNSKATRDMTDMLTTVVKEGTGTQGYFDSAAIAGKTGTTNDNKDAWYCGYSAYYTTCVWIGFDIPEPIPDSSYYSAIIWKQFMQKMHENLPRIEFEAYYNKYEEELKKQKEEEAAAEQASKEAVEKQSAEQESIAESIAASIASQQSSQEASQNSQSSQSNQNDQSQPTTGQSGGTSQPQSTPTSQQQLQSKPQTQTQPASRPGEWDADTSGMGDKDAG